MQLAFHSFHSKFPQASRKGCSFGGGGVKSGLRLDCRQYILFSSSPELVLMAWQALTGSDKKNNTYQNPAKLDHTLNPNVGT